MIKVSVVICTYNPKKEILNRVINSLKNQTFDTNCWELLIIDNNSSEQFSEWINFEGIHNATIIVEKKAGLTYARMAGFLNAIGELIILVDDDNVLNDDYIKRSYDFYMNNQQVGCFGGMSVPDFEAKPPSWFWETGISLGCQNWGNVQIVSNYNENEFQIKEYPYYAPIGTGMVINKKSLEAYINYINKSDSVITDRNGKSLSSGGDNEIVIFIIRSGWQIAYLPDLYITHLIPANRISFEYLCRMNEESYKSWVKLCLKHSIGDYKIISSWSVKLRKIKAYFMYRAFSSKLSYIKWKGACGLLEGQSIKF